MVDFHVDMSGRIYENRMIGIAIVCAERKINYGCALKGNLVRLVKKRLFSKNIFRDSAKLYAICIYLLLEEVREKIDTLIICNDEDFSEVERILLILGDFGFEIISISEFRDRLGRKIGSLADNYARIYRRRSLKPNRLSRGKKINVVDVNYKIIEKYWRILNESKM